MLIYPYLQQSSETNNNNINNNKNNNIEIQQLDDQSMKMQNRTITMACTPESHILPNTTQLKKQYPYPHLQGPPQSRTNAMDGDMMICGDSKMQEMEEGGVDVRAPQMVSHPTAVFSVQSHPLSAATFSAPVSPTSQRKSGSLDGSVAKGGVGGMCVAMSKSQLKVLVVDDAEMNRKMLSALLTRSNVSSDSVADGQLAVDAVATVTTGE